jgi:hypothetical protein
VVGRAGEIDLAADQPANAIAGGLGACLEADAMMPFHTTRFPAALELARRESFRLSRPSAILLDTELACLYVLTGAHKEFLAHRHVVLTVTPDGEELAGG